MLCWAHRVTELLVAGEASEGMTAALKADVTLKLREVVRTARELLGGDGILLNDRPMRALIDAEGPYTYEGTYEICVLIAGRELTGLSAFK
mmetsp:Transcript_41259/g.30334  ORF Transcript_41259/g.30334 Transcript_41259/m.30334 type:complete len:91 (-) Transcript_41259:40-312(-)